MRKAHKFFHRQYGPCIYVEVDGKAMRYPNGTRMYFTSKTAAMKFGI